MKSRTMDGRAGIICLPGLSNRRARSSINRERSLSPMGSASMRWSRSSSCSCFSCLVGALLSLPRQERSQTRGSCPYPLSRCALAGKRWLDAPAAQARAISDVTDTGARARPSRLPLERIAQKAPTVLFARRGRTRGTGAKNQGLPPAKSSQRPLLRSDHPSPGRGCPESSRHRSMREWLRFTSKRIPMRTNNSKTSSSLSSSTRHARTRGTAI